VPDQLEIRLRAERDRLDIDQPPLAVIAVRAGALRRRRRIAQGAVVAAMALTLGGVVTTVLHDRQPSPAKPAASDPAGVWTAEGVTINGLPHLPTDLPGTVRDAEFLDADHGFLLTVKCESTSSCTSWVSATTDGGRTWRTQVAPGPLGASAADKLPSMFVTGAEITLLGPGPRYVRASGTDGETWRLGESPAPTAEGPPLPGEAHLFPLGPSACGGSLAALTAGQGLVGVPRQPPISVCWAAPVRGGDGAWWVGGELAGKPAVAVSRDGGQSWQRTVFEGDGQAHVAMQGRDVFAVLVDPATTPARLLGVAASGDGGAHFGAVQPTAGQATIGGDLVPLLDGRLLIVDGVGHWLISQDRGITWHRLDGLHQTNRLVRTQAGYVAYEMTTIYTAFSFDGATWQKLDAQ
jgi:hypothetical protein